MVPLHARTSGLADYWLYLTCFYCYFQEHFFYFQEAELRMDVLQQHAALMGGASTTSCPLCHKLFLGSESLVEHMKVHHNDPTTVSQAVVQSERCSCKSIFLPPPLRSPLPDDLVRFRAIHIERLHRFARRFQPRNRFAVLQATPTSALARTWPNAGRRTTRVRCAVNTTWTRAVCENIWPATRKRRNTPNSGCGRVPFAKPCSPTNRVSALFRPTAKRAVHVYIVPTDVRIHPLDGANLHMYIYYEIFAHRRMRTELWGVNFFFFFFSISATRFYEFTLQCSNSNSSLTEQTGSSFEHSITVPYHVLFTD